MLSIEEIKKLTSEQMNKDIKKACDIHQQSMKLIRDTCKQVLEYSTLTSYLIFCATLEKLFTEMLDAAGKVVPRDVDTARRIVRMSETDVLAELSDKLGGDNGR